MFLLCQCNSCVMKTCGALAPIVQQTNEAGTNCSDVCIADVICRSTIVIVTILVAGFLAWKLIDNNAKENEREFNKHKEEEESKRKQEADEKNRVWQHEDEDRKQKAEELKRRWQFENEERKQKAEELKRCWQFEDEERKQKEDLLNKKLEMLQELCYEMDAETAQKIIKKYDSVEIKNYFEALINPRKVEPIKEVESNG